MMELPNPRETLSPAEIEACRHRIRFIHDQILLWEGSPTGDFRHLAVSYERLLEIQALGKKLVLIVDLTDCPRPTAAYRKAVQRIGMEVKHMFFRGAVVTGRSPFINIAAKIIITMIGYRTYSFHATLEDAKRACFRELNLPLAGV
ncbi:hypothetical protein [Pontibacter sp. G13]|uniref:hypothetical protein n=1 Tax=Pontibacter sp. G13 TaxID=3074898 RepID=UPI002889A258|nr:hypothetical protein [Pontibacter sp. G13]WNJ17257.1 hypothetical protein RJD25_20570 [Pontibacter sp. G13]